MTKKLFAIIATLAVGVIALFGCSGDHYNKVEISGVQSTEYTAAPFSTVTTFIS